VSDCCTARTLIPCGEEILSAAPQSPPGLGRSQEEFDRNWFFFFLLSTQLSRATPRRTPVKYFPIYIINAFVIRIVRAEHLSPDRIIIIRFFVRRRERRQGMATGRNSNWYALQIFFFFSYITHLHLFRDNRNVTYRVSVRNYGKLDRNSFFFLISLRP
jgi:hypothetical protein